jgi:hypothetical protein
VPGGHEPAPEILGQDDVFFLLDVGRPHRPSLAHGARHHADTGGQEVAGREAFELLPRQRHAAQRAIGLAQPQDRRRGLQRLAHALHDALGDGGGVQRLRECPRRLGQGVRLPL